jgi:formyltetrahydrofolate-dependent phosphoribosylglycinamide formyltransferase
MSNKSRLVVLASGYGSNLGAILEACQENKLPAEVVAIISDRKAAYALERAREHHIPDIYFPWKPYSQAGKTRQDYDADLAEKVAAFQPDLVVLAGWMRLLTMPFLSRFPMKVVNLHPALPGTFPGTHAIQRAFTAFQNEEISHTGVMVHFVPDEGVDDGPLITQEIVPVHPDDTLEILEQRIHAVEHRLLVSAISGVLTETKD